MKQYFALIVGAGCSSLSFTKALNDSGVLQKISYNKPILIIDQGKPYSERLETDPLDIVEGVGGAGTLAGGKICLPPASGRIWKKTRREMQLFSEFSEAMLPHENMAYTQIKNPFSGSPLRKKEYMSFLLPANKMRSYIQKLEADVEKIATIKPFTQFVSFEKRCEYSSGEYFEVCLWDKLHDDLETIKTEHLIFATGRSSAMKLQEWLSGVSVRQQCPDLGIRMSVSLNKTPFFDIGRDTKIKWCRNGVEARTFCVCAGGESVKAELFNQCYYDGHFGPKISGLVNMGVLVRSPFLHGIDEAVGYMELLQKYIGWEMSYKEFKRWYKFLIPETSRYDIVFDSACEFVDKLIKYHYIEERESNIQIYLPSCDNFNPIIETDANFETAYNNLYVIGDAAGISRGYVQAMWSGYCAARNIVDKALRDCEENGRRVYV